MRDEKEIAAISAAEAAGASPVLPPHPSSPILHPFIGRWKHRLKLHFRVWPKFKETHQAIAKEKIIPVNGIRITDDGKPEIWNQTSGGICGAVFEISDEDFDIITAIPKAGARMPMYRNMVVHAPGTTANHVKMECWLEVPVFAYPDASERKITLWGCNWSANAPHEVFGETPKDALGLAGAPTDRIVFIENDEDVDENIIWREIVENNAMVVLNRRPGSGLRCGVSTEMGHKLIEKASFWTVPGREPWEDGGALRGYQFPDRIVRWNRRVEVENREAETAARLDRMHETTREIGRSNRRKYFLENTVTRFAERIGWPRQRVMARFLDDGIVDWLMRSVDNVQPILYRETSSLLRGRISDAVNALEFYYRAIEGMVRGNREEGRGKREDVGG